MASTLPRSPCSSGPAPLEGLAQRDRRVRFIPSEIAFHENRKEHSVYVEALKDYLEKRGTRTSCEPQQHTSTLTCDELKRGAYDERAADKI